MMSLGSAYLELGYSTLSGAGKLVAMKPNKSNSKKDVSQYLDIMTLVLLQFNVIPLCPDEILLYMSAKYTAGKNKDPEEKNENVHA